MKKHFIGLLLVALTIVSCGSPGPANKDEQAGEPVVKKQRRISGPIIVVNTAGGKVVGGKPSKKTLYIYHQDNKGESNCYSACAAAWPPFLVSDSPQQAPDSLTVIERKDGSRQWAFEGQPLYFWQGDNKLGDAGGDGKGGVWDALRP